jgi:hypothetical protein
VVEELLGAMHAQGCSLQLCYDAVDQAACK